MSCTSRLMKKIKDQIIDGKVIVEVAGTGQVKEVIPKKSCFL